MDTAKAVEFLAGKVAKAKAAKGEARKRASRARAPSTRRRYLPADLLRIAQLAGEGKSGSEIAEAIGGTSRDRIAALVSRYGIGLVPKKPSEAVVRVVVPRDALAALSAMATRRDCNPTVLMGAALTALAAEPVLLGNLLDPEI